MSPALYDLSPVLRLLLVGVALAAVPLLWVWLRHRGTSPMGRYQALTIVTLFLTFDLVLFGAFTRLTDSGLGCPDWPGCYGSASPLGAKEAIATAQAAMPTGPVTHGKAWVEMVHRYLATGVGGLILVLCVVAWLGRKSYLQQHRVSPWLPTFTLLWVCVQGAFGALTVTMKLFPAIVSLHLLGAYLLLALLTVQVVRNGGVGAVAVPSWVKPWAATALAMLVLQAASGAWVSTNYAVLACTEFPMCQGSWWPAMDFAQGFEIWRPLGLLKDGSHIGFAALTAIHYVHRLFAYLVLAVLLVLGWRMLRAGDATHPVAAQGRWLLALAALQLVTGLSNVILDWPLAAAVLHTGGAAALVGVLTWALAASRARAAQPAWEASNTPLATAKAKA
jgi:cytochrome c oxidase assembly protein subunit 15